MSVETFLRGVRRLVVEPGLVSTITDLVQALGPRVDWRAFSAVPGERPQLRTLSRLRAAALAPFTPHTYLSTSPFQQYHLRRLARRRGPDAAMVFEFLCLGQPVPLTRLEEWMGAARVAAFLETGLLVPLDDQVAALGLKLVPVGDHFYVADADDAVRHGPAYGIDPTNVTTQTGDILDWLRPVLSRMRPARMLEMGSSSGIVLLEMRDLVRERVGAEILARPRQLALVNRALRRDHAVRFMRSDLFEDVSGTFDVIFFNPWQPSFEHLGLLRRFLARAPAHLAPGGWIGLWASTHTPAAEVDPVVDLVRDFSEQERFQVTRHVIHSWFAANRHVDTLSCFVMARRTLARRDWRLVHDAGSLEWRARRVLTGRT